MQLQQDQNIYNLTDDQKSNINKRLPTGFCLVKITQLQQSKTRPFYGQIKYMPVKPQPYFVNNHLVQQTFPIPTLSPHTNKSRISNSIHTPRQVTLKKQNSKLSGDFISTIKGKNTYQIPQNKSRQAEKIKNIIQRLRKHPKFQSFALHLTKLGFYGGFAQIQLQSKKNLLTIDAFKEKCMHVFNCTRNATYVTQTLQLIDEMTQQFVFYVDQAKRTQFSNNLTSIQKSIDKITRELSDIKDQGSWYLRKKKKSQKNFDEKQILYISDLVRALPTPYLIGVWQIIDDRPFPQAFNSEIDINFSQLKQKKLRQIQAYVKKKLTNLHKSRQRKRQKMERKKQQKRSQMNPQSMSQIKKDQSSYKQSKIGQNQDPFQTPIRSENQSNYRPKDEKFQAVSQKSYTNNPQMPPTPQFNPKRAKQIPGLQSLKEQSIFKLSDPNKQKNKKQKQIDLMDDIFAEDMFKERYQQQQDDFLNIEQFGPSEKFIRKEQPRIIQSPLIWNQEFDQSNVMKNEARNYYQNDSPYKSKDFSSNMNKQQSQNMQFEPLTPILAQEKQNLNNQQGRSQANPPSFQQGDQFINRQDQFSISQKPQRRNKKNEKQGQEQKQDGQYQQGDQQQQLSESFSSSDSSMITDQDDSDF